MTSIRNALVTAHRLTGLTIGLFLVIAALTGSLLAFYAPLDAAMNPGLFRVTPPSAAAIPLDPLTLRERAARHLGEDRVNWMDLSAKPGEAFVAYIEGTEGGDDEFFFDPYTGELLGSRRWGDLKQGFVNLLPFIYRLHYSLALEEAGVLLMGVVALLWTVDCFIGMALTFPPRSARGKNTGTWWRRWGGAWRVWTGSAFRVIFSWHRASGLWIWAMLFVFAWSAVGLNLRPVYQPVMKALFGMDEPSERIPDLPAARNPGIDWRTALGRGRELMAREAATRKFTVLEERAIDYRPQQGAFRYQVRSSLDVSTRYPRTTVWFDGQTGELVAFRAPTGGALGNTLTTWIDALHFAAVGGLPFQIFVSLAGLLTAGLVITGTSIWWKKRRARRAGRRGSPTASAKNGSAPRPSPSPVGRSAGRA